MKKLFFFIAFLFISYSSIIAQGTLSATMDDNDAFITLNWELPKQTCLTNNGTPYPDGVYVRLLVDGQEVYSERIIDLTNIGATYNQTYLHNVGPDASINYSLEVRKIGIGSLLCGPLLATGSTLAFQPPTEFTASDVTNDPNQAKPDSILLSWINNSELASTYLVLRNGEVIGTVNEIDSVNQALYFTDVFIVGDTNSLVNGETYTYEIQTEASLNGQNYSTGITDIGNTIPINLLATDGLNGEPQDMVKLSWNNMAAFCEEIRVLRGDALIATIANNATDYIDDDPTFGEKVPYQVQLIENGIIKVSTVDTGFVAAIGLISGKVLTETGNYPIDSASIILSYLAGDIAIYDTIYTDESGCFNLTDIKYGRATQLKVAVNKTGFDFENALDTIFLTNESPTFTQLLFLAETEYPETTNTIDFSNLSIQPFDQGDYVQLNWEYVPDLTAITFFNIYRSGVLIARLSDKNGAVATTYMDKTGRPEVDYTYVVNYFRIENGALIDSSSQVLQTFPAVTKVPSLTANFDNVGGKVDLNWTHPSTNFSGFYIYRDLEIIDSLPNTATSYTDFSGVSNISYTYKISAYRTVDRVDFTSDLTEAEMGNYPTLPPALYPEVYEIEKATYVKIRWTIPTLLTPNYNYSGFSVYRKLGNSTEDFELLGEIDKYFITNDVYEFSDFTGKSGFNYEYEVRTFVETATSFFEVSTNPLPFTYPEVSDNITSTSTNIGNNFVGIEWDYEIIPVVNIDGYIISKGTVNDSIATLAYGDSKFDYYLTPNEYGQALTFFVRGYRLVDGMLFYSMQPAIPVQHIATKDNTPEIPTQVTATKDLAGLIKICWEYPDFIQATFKVYRKPGLNGANQELLTELTTTERAYYDYATDPGVRYEYEVVADYEGNESSPAKTSGKARQFNRLSGRIYSSQTGIGTPKVKVELVNEDEEIILGSFFSDSTGYYLFENIQVPSGTNLVVCARS